jgi:hypothetical protein
MQLVRKARITLFAACACLSLAASKCAAIVLGQIDEFTAGTELNWFGAAAENVADPMPAEVGDLALQVAALGGLGSGSRLVVTNSAQWQGNWTAAGVTRLQFDLLNPNPSGNLTIRLGIAGPGSPGQGGTGPTYGSVESLVVPADNQWHTLTFDVSAAGWQNLGGTNIVTALASVDQFRILHNPVVSFMGEAIAAVFLVDNISALAAPVDVDGDYNDDGTVGAADFTVWRDTNGQNGPDLPADGNGDMTVDSADYDHWKQRFGNEAGNGAQANLADEASAIPRCEVAIVATAPHGTAVRPSRVDSVSA